MQLFDGLGRGIAIHPVRGDDEHDRRTRGEQARRASVTAITGGESMMTAVELLAQRLQKRLEALRPEQLRRVRRHAAGGSIHRPGTIDFPIASLGLRIADEQVRKPRLLRRLKISCMRGRRMSASMSSTRWPAWANPIARLLATMRLAFARARARDDERPRSLIGGREQDVGADASGTPRRNSRARRC